MSKSMDNRWSNFQFRDYVFTELKFSIHKDWWKNIQFEEAPARIAFDVKINIEEEETVDRGEIELICGINDDDNSQNDTPFEIKTVMLGRFYIENKIDKKTMEQFLRINGVAAMFPFLRSAIADLSRIGNIEPTMLLPLMNVNTMISQIIQIYEN